MIEDPHAKERATWFELGRVAGQIEGIVDGLDRAILLAKAASRDARGYRSMILASHIALLERQRDEIARAAAERVGWHR